MLSRLAHSRLAQFIMVGGLVFAASSAYSKTQSRSIDLPPGELEARREAELRKKPLAGNTHLEVDATVAERAVEDEILYRKGLELGFDRNDAIIRARVIQKTLFLAEELAGASEPASDAELRAFYESTKARWKRPERWHVVQIFATHRTSLDAIRAEADAHATDLAALGALGEPSPLPRETTLVRADAETTLGADFVRALPTGPTTGFSEPVKSNLGWHLVRVMGHEAEAPASFEEMRDSLRGRYAIQRRQDAVASYLEKSFPEYDVRIGDRKITEIHPQGRMAVRKTGSAED